MTRRIVWVLILALLVVVASGCIFSRPQGNLVITEVIREDDHWNVVFKNTGDVSVRVASSVFTAYNADGEKLHTHYGPSGYDGRPFVGLSSIGPSDSIRYRLWKGNIVSTKLFAGVDGVHTIEVNVMWKSVAGNVDWQWLEATLPAE